MNPHKPAPSAITPSVPDVINRIGRDAGKAVHPDAFKVQLIARSPDTKVAREMLARLPEFEAQGVGFEAIFTRLSGTDVLGAVAVVYGAETARRTVRVVNIPEQGEIVEQVNFGRVAVWTGKPLKAWVSTAFEDGKLSMSGEGSDAAQLASLAFRALWSVAEAPANDFGPAGLKALSAG
ncbi:MAG: hypothetical protein FP825_10550 [Hyphomonas sp.]|uniref:hypothetical protein n=1 Tax=Hyphomonas sp. TaxID=87 RepID=UPI0018331C01|nr:hypothetical protein [Hyphomonas sp.]MBU3921964.1 hypothetical protein [Alphaproteobacteria bacterium]MBA3068910.1 hypothetical protein [Hyphomonas sp.]MBU4061092.1 hypothetical protein [Alphaproteobacteria bacterium]MBU4162816.1 hypothetical protein [Alphaproteobacteria bacterium]MBU4568317.1 hypothetical protein [Alphaproteobacteria bacterium]